MRGAVRRHRVAVAAAMLVVVLLGLARGFGDREPLPPDAAASTPTAAAAATVHASTAAIVPATAEREQAAAGQAAVHGFLRFATGKPLPGMPVTLRRLDVVRPPRLLSNEAVPPIEPSVAATSGDDGGFVFPDLAAGRYRVALSGSLGTVEEDFVLGAGERREVVLTVRGALVRATVFTGETALPSARYRVRRAGDEDREGRADGNGEFWLLLPPGSYEVQVLSDIWPVAPLGVQTFDVPTGVTHTSWRLEAAGTALEVCVRDGDGCAAAAFTVRLDGVLAANRERAVREFPGTGGLASFAGIPEGEWQVSVRAADFLAPPARDWTTRSSIPRERLEFTVAPAVVVPLVLLRPDRRPFRVDPELLPWLAVGEHLVPCVPIGAVDENYLPKQIAYLGVPPGRASLVLEDKADAQGIEYLPFEPQAPIQVDVVRGATPPLQVMVTPRAEVDLRGCEAIGREDLTARVQVFVGNREVRGRPRLPAQRWLGWLPPGDYRVVVTRSTGEREHSLRVDAADVHLRLRP